ncbi:hypothetical protein JCM3765_004509 [Sporobolomyces pararoseus]
MSNKSSQSVTSTPASSTNNSTSSRTTRQPSKVAHSSTSPTPSTQSSSVRSTSPSTRTRQLNEPWRRKQKVEIGWASKEEDEKDEILNGDPKVQQRSKSEPKGSNGGSPSATAQATVQDLASADSAVASTDLSTPRSNQQSPLPTSQAPTSTSDSTKDNKLDTATKFTAEAAFEVDDLLGPRPRRIPQTSTSSTASSSGPSQPASTHSDEDHHSLVIETKVQGLGLVTQGCLEGDDGMENEGEDQALKAPGTFRDGYFDDEEDTDESWLHYSSSSKRRGGGTDQNDGTSSTSHHHSSSNTSNSPPSHASSPPTYSTNPFGSPLSPHVPPFSPGLIEIGQFSSNSTTTNQVQSHPWTTPSAVLMGSARMAGAREREASWASIASEPRGTFTSPSLRSTFGNAIASASESHASSTGSYSPFASPPPSLYRNDLSSNSSPAFPHSSTMPFTPPSSHTESFESHQSVPTKETIAASRYVRAPYTIHSQTSSNTLNGGGGETLSTPTAQEDISTLFVFGFPEDMMEREFQNLFLFAPGFEVATLKVPHSSLGGEEMDTITRTVGGHRGSIDEYDPRSPVTPNGGGGAASLTLLAKKQKIGFAKFSTKQHAMDAMEVLNKKRVDQEKGLALKADLAKKNLHIRRSNAGLGGSSLTAVLPGQVDQAVGSIASSVSSLSNSSALPPPPSITAAGTTSSSSSSSTTSSEAAIVAALQGTGPSIPLSVLDPETLKNLANSRDVNPAVLAEIARQRSASISTSSPSTGMSAYEAFHSVPSVNATTSSLDRQGYFDSKVDQEQGSTYLNRAPSSHALTRHSSLVGTFTSQQGMDDYSRSSSNYATQPSPYLSNDNGFASTTPRVPFPQQSKSSSQSLPYGFHGSQLVPAIVRPQTLAQQQASSKIASQHQAQIAAAQAYARTLNPADMNAPKNTLYVGGLPAILPSLTGPFSASHLEDSLRNAFSRCPGFKRLQFRSKSNGPIVFVEFEDTAYATRAMNEMYGYTLGGLVKGGIRLSYSKNPLGVRSNGLLSGNPPPLPSTYIATTQVDPSLNPVVYPAYAVSYATPPPSLVETHRRHPDPFYGASAYTSSNTTSTPTSYNNNNSSTSLDQHHHRTSLVSASGISTPLQSATSSTGTSTATSQASFSSTFSPFGTEY